MIKNINENAEKVKGELKQKATVVFKWAMAIIYLILVIHFVLKPITEFLLVCENYVRLYLLNYFFR